MSNLQRVECFKCSDGQFEQTPTRAIARELCFYLDKDACHKLDFLTAEILVNNRELVLDVLGRMFEEAERQWSDGDTFPR